MDEKILNRAISYLSKFLASKRKLSLFLNNKFPDKNISQINEVLDYLEEKKIIDDTALAKLKIVSMNQKGFPIKSIKQKLMQMGINSDIFPIAIQHLRTYLNDYDPNLVATIIYAKKRKLGPFTPNKSIDNNLLIAKSSNQKNDKYLAKKKLFNRIGDNSAIEKVMEMQEKQAIAILEDVNYN